MLRIPGFAAVLSLCLLTMAPSALSQEGKFLLQLNNLKPVQAKCRAVFRATNNLGTPIDKTIIKIGVVEKSEEGSLMSFEFNRVAAGKTKFFEFDLDRACEQIASLVFNEITECSGPGGPIKDCEANTVVSSRIKTSFD